MPTKTDDAGYLHAMRHSLAHIMASAVQNLWPKAKFGVGPVVEAGFYYDIDLGKDTLSEEDLPRIESEMHRIVAEDQKFERSEIPVAKAISWAKQHHQDYKLELLNDLKRTGTTAVKELEATEPGLSSGQKAKIDKVSFYTNGDFVDLCRGPHVPSTRETGAFKLTKVSGAYWRGQETNPQMQRIYGVAFANKAELDKHLTVTEEARRRDHRKLGRELDLFVFSDLVGAGLPLFTPRGTILRDKLNEFSQELRSQDGYQKVWSPHITKRVLYEKSGHWDKFGDELFLVRSQETSDELVLKPMNCPHHQQIYAARPRSYRDLPLKYMETTTVYRDEKTGEMSGLGRVRAITQDDSHTFCTPEQIYDVLSSLVAMAVDCYKIIGLPLRARLSLRDDSDAYLGDKKLWKQAEDILRRVAKDSKLDYFEAVGEAAFYGPKIDFLAFDALGRELQVATPQLDFVQPERFGLSYTDKDGSEKTPVMVHFALLGSIERFLAVYIEHTAGRFPLWLSPEQLRVVTVNDDKANLDFASKLVEQAKELGLRAGLDSSNESVGKKIRTAEIMKIPYLVVIGDKEVTSGKVIPRVRKDLEAVKEHASLPPDKFLAGLANEATSRAAKSSL